MIEDDNLKEYSIVLKHEGNIIYSKTGTEKKLFTAFANLRNSLHGNGIHRTNTFLVLWANLESILFYSLSSPLVEFITY